MASIQARTPTAMTVTSCSRAASRRNMSMTYLCVLLRNLRTRRRKKNSNRAISESSATEATSSSLTVCLYRTTSSSHRTSTKRLPSIPAQSRCRDLLAIPCAPKSMARRSLPFTTTPDIAWTRSASSRLNTAAMPDPSITTQISLTPVNSRPLIPYRFHLPPLRFPPCT